MSNVISNVIGILGFLFLFWRRTKEDYSSDQIFSFSFTIVLGILIGFLVGSFIGNKIPSSNIFSPKSLWFWGSFIGGCIGFEIAFLKSKLRFFENLEAASLGFIFWIFAISLISSIQTLDLKLLTYSVILGSLIPLFFFFSSHYKRFAWYKSGKIGFAGLATLAVFFLTRFLVALIDPAMLSFTSKFDAIIDITVAFAFFITLFKLAEK